MGGGGGGEVRVECWRRVCLWEIIDTFEKIIH